MKTFLVALALALSFFVTAQPRFTDSTFGTNGKVIENTSIPDVKITDALLQPDGKILTLASADYYTIPITPSNYDALTRTVLIRYNQDGSPDVSFSSDGVADSLIVPDASCYPKAIRLQPDGRILVCGIKGQYSADQKAFVMRYNSSGSLDTSFASNGILYLSSFTQNSTSFKLFAIEDMTLLPDGKVTLLSNRGYPYYDLILTRINANGTVDSSFGTSGFVTTNPLNNSSGYPNYSRIEVLGNGKYIVGGNPGTTSSSGTAQTYIVIRFNANGTPDNTYGTNGSIRLTGGPNIDKLEDLVIYPDGKVLIGGSENDYNTCSYVCLQRLTTNGTLDATFGSGGKQIVRTLSTGFVALRTYMNLQADGKILIGGRARKSNGNYTMAVARLTVNGLFDTGFDGDGVAPLQVNNYNSFGYIPLQQIDGRIVVAGFVCSPNPTLLSIGRVTATGLADATLDAATTAIRLNNGADAEWGVNVMVQPVDQKIVSVRERLNGFDFDVYVSRHLSNGQPDSSFGINGKTYLSIPGYLFYVRCSGLSADGKITVVTYFLNFTVFDSITRSTLGIYRLKADGQPDSSFGQYGSKIFESRTVDTVIDSHVSPAIQPDGKIVVAAHRYKGGTPLQDSTFLLRLNNDGSYDNTFNTGRFRSPSQDIQLAAQPDGKILLAATEGVAPETYITKLKRLNTNGSTDATFNNGTDKVVNIRLAHMAVQFNGKVVLSQKNSITRLLSNGIFDSTFGINGTVDISNYYGQDGSGQFTLDNNRILIAGDLQDSTNPYYYQPKILALQNNGLPDSAFGQSGIILPDLSPNGSVARIALQADGRIVLIGSAATFDNPLLGNFALTRIKNTNIAGRTYTFTGNGLWSNPANWADGMMPPTVVPVGSTIVIDPPATGECVIDISVEVKAGATVILKAGKKARLLGNLIIQ